MKICCIWFPFNSDDQITLKKKKKKLQVITVFGLFESVFLLLIWLINGKNPASFLILLVSFEVETLIVFDDTLFKQLFPFSASMMFSVFVTDAAVSLQRMAATQETVKMDISYQCVSQL